MARFETAMHGLHNGDRVRRQLWEPITTMFIVCGSLMCQRGTAAPVDYRLSWEDLNATDWRVIGATAS